MKAERQEEERKDRVACSAGRWEAQPPESGHEKTEWCLFRETEGARGGIWCENWHIPSVRDLTALECVVFSWGRATVLHRTGGLLRYLSLWQDSKRRGAGGKPCSYRSCKLLGPEAV